jgi:hypothetical protein
MQRKTVHSATIAINWPLSSRISRKFDEKLFLLNRQASSLSFRIYDINAHPSFSTGFDYIFSRITANELLAGYLRKTL